MKEYHSPSQHYYSGKKVSKWKSFLQKDTSYLKKKNKQWKTSIKKLVTTK